MSDVLEVPAAEDVAVIVSDMKILASYLEQMESRLLQLSPATLAPAVASDPGGRQALCQLRTANDRLRHILWILHKNVAPAPTR